MKNDTGKFFSLGSVYLVGSIIEKGIGFLLLPISTFFLVPEEYGAAGIMLLAANLAALFISVPVNSGIFRFYYLFKEPEERNERIFSGMVFILLHAIPLMIVFYVLSSTISNHFLGNPRYSEAARIFSLVILFQPVKSYFLALLQIQKRAFLFISISISRMILFIALVFILFKFCNMRLPGLAYGYLFFSAYDVVMLLPFLRRYLSPNRKLSALKPLLFYGYPLLLASISMFIFQFSDRFVLSLFSSLSTVGLFIFAGNFQTLFLALIYEPSKKALNPVVFERENEANAVRDLLRKIATYVCMASFTIWIFLSVFSKEIVHLLGRNEQYWDAWKLVPLIAFAGVMFSLHDIAGKGLALAKKTVTIMTISISGCVLNILLNFILIPFWGAYGAAIATCIAFAGMLCMKAWYSYRIYSQTFENRKIFIICVASVVVCFMGIMCNIFPVSYAVIFKIASICCFPVFLYFLRVVSGRDIISFMNLMKGQLGKRKSENADILAEYKQNNAY